MDFIGLVWLFPVIMCLAALVNGLGCRKLGRIAGYVSVGAMAATFLLAVAVFFNVKSYAPHHGAEGEHAAAHHEEGHAEHSDDPAVTQWHGMTADEQHTIKAQYTFVKADPENPRPWDTEVRGGLGGYVLLWSWMPIPNVLDSGKPMSIDLAFHVDQLTSIFLLFVSFVGMLVFIYATGYMKEKHNGHEELDPSYARFFAYLALFAASMYTLVLGANFAVMFIGWEGVGLCSYLLIGFFLDKQFSEKLTCADAGKKAFVVNRVGDFGLIVAMGLIFWGLGTLDFQTVIHKLSFGDVPAGWGYGGALITAATLLLFLGATGKSAQIPLFTWLPDAMAGPTPVSALIHAATMVTAGVYMLARLNVLYMLAPAALVVVAVVGAATAFVAASIGLTQRGIKKILAYSTVSQLGYMFLAMGVGAFAAGIFHVFTHAFFKACLFLAAGSVIHALHHEEDVFKMGGLRKKMPLTWFAYGMATLAIAGIVPFAGFFSKDEILYMNFVAGQGSTVHLFLWIVGLITAAFTAFYMGRSLFLAFHGKTRLETAADHGHHEPHGHEGHIEHGAGDHHAHHGVPYEKVHESHISMTGVLVVLGVASLVVGWFNIPKGLINLGELNGLFHHFLAPVTDRGSLVVANAIGAGMPHDTAALGPVIVGDVQHEGVLDVAYHGPEILLAIVSVLIAAGGLGLAWVLYGSGDLSKGRKLAKNPLLKPFWNISWSGWRWDDAYDALFVRGAMALYAGVLWIDRNIVDGIVNGAGRLSRGLGNEFRRLQNGQVQVYGLVMFLGVCLFLLYFALGLTRFLTNDPVMEIQNNRRDVPALSDVAPQGEQVSAVIESDHSRTEQ